MRASSNHHCLGRSGDGGLPASGWHTKECLRRVRGAHTSHYVDTFSFDFAY